MAVIGESLTFTKKLESIRSFVNWSAKYPVDALKGKAFFPLIEEK